MMDIQDLSNQLRTPTDKLSLSSKLINNNSVKRGMVDKHNLTVEGKEIKNYEGNALSEEKLKRLSVLNIPYEIDQNEPELEEIEKRLNFMSRDIKKRVKGYSIQNDVATLVRTKIARITLYEDKE